jgi:predicted Ser/Thr protein kinase
MPQLSPQDIAFGKAALTNGVITRPQLDSAVSFFNSGRAQDLQRALMATGGISPTQLERLQSQLGPGTARVAPPISGSQFRDLNEAKTLSDDEDEPTVPDGAMFAPGFTPPPNFGAPPPRAPGFGPPPGGSAFGPPPSSFGPPPSSFGPPPSSFGPPPAGFGPPSAFGPPAGGFAPPGGSAFGPPGGSAFGPPPVGGFNSGSGAHQPFGLGPPPAGGSAFGAPVGGSAFGPPPGGSAFGPPAGGSAFGGGAFGAAAPAPFQATPSSFGSGRLAPPVGGSAFGAPTGPTSPVVEGEDEQIGHWVIERELARGGMGVIYVGIHESTGEKAAIKVMLQTDGAVAERKVRRFLREIDANKKLVHEGIVRIIDSGEFRGYPFFAMEFIDGKPLDRLLKDDLDLEIGMEVIERIARAAHYAHEQGVIHRDLKPANVIVIVDGDNMTPKLTDFGLAKNKDHQSVLTKTGAVLGTPYYLSPEQAQGRSKTLDRRADIYSLGVIMYELATGRLPFVGQTTVELYNRIIHDDPVPPTKIKPQLTKALETVCLKAMAKEPDERYATADLFADDVAALLQGGTISAKADGPIKRLLKRMKKRGSVPVVVGTTVVLLGLVVGGLTFHHKRTADALHARMVGQELQTLEELYTTKLTLAASKLATGEEDLRAGRLPESLEAPKAALAALEDLAARATTLKFPKENAETADGLAKKHADLRAKLHARTLVLRARVTMLRDERGTLERAQTDLESVLKDAEKGGIRPGDPQALVAQGDLYVLTGNLSEALVQYTKALERSPNSVHAYLGRARARVMKEEFDEAISDVTRGLNYLGGAKPPEPSEDADEGEEKKPIELEVIPEEQKGELAAHLQLSRARARLEKGETQKALDDALTAGKTLAKGWEPKAFEGLVLARQGKVFLARDAYAAAISNAPQEAGPYSARAEGLLELGYPELAFEDAKTAVSLDPRSLQALVLRAAAQEELLNFEEAEQDAEAAQLRSQTRHWRVASTAERVLARLDAIDGSIPDAHDHAKKARSLDEYSSKSKLLQARLELDPYFEGQYLDSAERLLKQVLRQRPRSIEAKRGLGLALQQKFVSQPERAERKLEEAQELDAWDPETLAALARVQEAKAKKDPTRTESHREAAARNWSKAARYGRDVRRASGLAYAIGLRNQLKGQKLSAGSQADHWAQAQRAYRRAILLTPSHVNAETGLASIAHLQLSFRRTGAHLKKAVEANPLAILPAVLNAKHLATVDGLKDSSGSADRTLKQALALRGETTELLMCKLFLDGLKATTKPVETIKTIHEGFLKLRKVDPFDETIYKKEIELLARLADRRPRGRQDREKARESRARFRAKLRAVRGELHTLQETLGERESQAKTLRALATKLLKGNDTLAPLDPAYRAATFTPWDADVWWTLALARSKSGEDLGSLAACLRAAYLDEAYVAPLFERLRGAGLDPWDDAEEATSALLVDSDVLPFPSDLEDLLRATPLVARALVSDVDSKQAKTLFSALEKALNNDPTRLLCHAMLGALAYGVRRDEYAILHLLFVGTVREDMGEAFYLAAIAAARLARGKDHKLEVLAIQSLQKAERSGFKKWRKLAEQEKSLKRLRKSDLWQRIDSD